MSGRHRRILKEFFSLVSGWTNNYQQFRGYNILLKEDEGNGCGAWRFSVTYLGICSSTKCRLYHHHAQIIEYL